MTNHSPLPWFIHHPENDNDRIGILTPDQIVADVWGDEISGVSATEMQANAAFIVDACNNYEAVRAENARLQEALKLILEISDRNDYETYRQTVTEIARAALGKDE